MGKILLIIQDFRLRQLYHERLFSTETEVVPVDDLASAVLLLTLDYFTLAVFYVEDDEEAAVFLKLRERHERFSQIRFVLLAADNDFQDLMQLKDVILSPVDLSVGEITVKIRKLLKNSV